MSDRSSAASVVEQGGGSSNVGGGGGAHRLPQLSMDPKQRLQRLIKPKPLPREVLSGKVQAGGH